MTTEVLCEEPALTLKEEVAERMREGLKGFIFETDTPETRRAISIKAEEILRDKANKYDF